MRFLNDGHFGAASRMILVPRTPPEMALSLSLSGGEEIEDHVCLRHHGHLAPPAASEKQRNARFLIRATFGPTLKSSSDVLGWVLSACFPITIFLCGIRNLFLGTVHQAAFQRFFPPNSLLLGVLNSFLRCVRPFCHCWFGACTAGVRPFPLAMQHFYSFVSHVISVLLSARFGACTAGVHPFLLAMQHV